MTQSGTVSQLCVSGNCATVGWKMREGVLGNTKMEGKARSIRGGFKLCLMYSLEREQNLVVEWGSTGKYSKEEVDKEKGSQVDEESRQGYSD